jgi:peroxiredoxin
MRRSPTIPTLLLSAALAACSGESAPAAPAPPQDLPGPSVPSAPPAVAEDDRDEDGEPTEQAAGEGVAAPATATVGSLAPEFTLTDQAGTTHRLSQYRGKVVVLEWINPGCPYVQRHYQARTMRELVDAFPADRVQWLAIDSSHFVQPAESEAWRREHQLPYPILQDASGRVGRIYEARTTPHMFVIDPTGTLRYAGAIDDDPRGRNEQRTNHVRTAVQALLDGRAPPVSSTEPYGCTVKYENS